MRVGERDAIGNGDALGDCLGIPLVGRLGLGERAADGLLHAVDVDLAAGERLGLGLADVVAVRRVIFSDCLGDGFRLHEPVPDRDAVQRRVRLGLELADGDAVKRSDGLGVALERGIELGLCVVKRVAERQRHVNGIRHGVLHAVGSGNALSFDFLGQRVGKLLIDRLAVSPEQRVRRNAFGGGDAFGDPLAERVGVRLALRERNADGLLLGICHGCGLLLDPTFDKRGRDGQ